MTDEQIIALVKEYFTEGGIQDDGSCNEWYGKTDAFLKFARAIRQDGYTEGYDDGRWEANYNNSMQEFFQRMD